MMGKRVAVRSTPWNSIEQLSFFFQFSRLFVFAMTTSPRFDLEFTCLRVLLQFFGPFDITFSVPSVSPLFAFLFVGFHG